MRARKTWRAIRAKKSPKGWTACASASPNITISGARFAKWRGVIDIAGHTPSWGCIKANAHALARYAALCQEAGIVPIVEPEVLMDGPDASHDIERCFHVTHWTLQTVFSELAEARVSLEGMVLKPNMVIAG
jgi:fructose-bisphosphate aldolase class I